jgi:RimJ/RimL family protein N-acetyltransferase
MVQACAVCDSRGVIAFRTERLDITRWTHEPSDVARILDIYARWEVAQWLGTHPRAIATLDEASAKVDRWAARCIDYQGVWAVRVRSTGVAAGTVLLVPLPESQQLEVGWHLHPDSWGHGYASEAARGALAHGFAHGLNEIFAVVRPANERSLALCRRLGMTPLGITDRWYGAEMELYRSTAPER